MRKFWENWDERERNAAVRITGLCTATLAVFILISTVSYLFHWRQDMSLLGDPSMMDRAREVGNAAGKLGVRTGHLLVCNLFGLGSLALLVILAALSVRLLLGNWKYSLVRTFLVALSGAFVWSVFLAFIGSVIGLPDVFGGGLGGHCGALVCSWAVNLVGYFITGFLVLLMVVCWLFCSSGRFAAWFGSLGRPDAADERAEAELPETEPEERPRRVRRIVPEPEPAPEPEPGLVTGPVSATPLEVQPSAGPDVSSGPLAVHDDQGITIVEDDTLDQEVRELKPIDNRLDPPDGLPRYRFPSIDLLGSYASARHEVSTEELTVNNNRIRTTLANYRISVDDVKAIIGPTVTLYKVYPSAGVQIAQIKRLQEDIALSLNAKGVRVVTLSDSVGIEVANSVSSIVPLKSLLNDRSFRESKAELPIAIGYTITQKVKVFDLADAPHLLIAGATKQGKSVGLNVIVNSLLYARHPSELKFVFIDPKMVEFSAYGDLIHHYLAVLPDSASEEDERAEAIVKKPKDAERILRSLCTEMDDRYELLAKAGANNIKSYNEKYKARKVNPKNGHRFLPYVVVVVDEYADLTMTTGAAPEARANSRSITNSIIRLAQKGRAAGLHVILATQRPSVDVISGIIKSNFPMRIAFRVASRTDSMTILDSPGAEKLIGKGDMLFSAGIDNERIQCGYISTEEIESITGFIGDQIGVGKSYNTPYYLPSAEEAGAEGGSGGGEMGDLDERFEEAARLVVTSGKASTSYLQTRLGMGFAKAARVMGQLEAAGIVGPQEGAKPRQILVSDPVSLESLLNDVLK